MLVNRCKAGLVEGGRGMKHRDDTTGSSRFSRRGFLGKVGVGAVALGARGRSLLPARRRRNGQARRITNSASPFEHRRN